MRLSEVIVRCVDRLYIRPVAPLVPLQIFRYALCGGLNLLFGWVCYFVIYQFVIAKSFVDLGFVTLSPHVAALLLVFPLTFAAGFWLNSRVAFRRSPLRTRTQLFRYALSVAGSVVVNYACLKLFVECFGIWATPSQMLASLITMAYSYLAAKYFTFLHAEEP